MGKGIDDKLLKEISEILTVENFIQLESRQKLDENIAASKEIESDYDEILAQQNALLDELQSDSEISRFSLHKKSQLFSEKIQDIREKKQKIQFDDNMLEEIEVGTDWEDNVKQVRKYAEDRGIDLSNPFFSMFSRAEVIQINHQLVEHFDLCRLDKIDYCIAAAFGILAGIIDIVLVGTVGSNTKSSTLQDKVDKVYDQVIRRYAIFERVEELENRKQVISKKAPEQKDKILEINKKIEDTKQWNKRNAIGYLEKRYKVSYDLSVNKGDTPWLNPSNHHLLSLAHEPSIMGLIVGIVDQICGKTTLISPETGDIVRIVSSHIGESEDISSISMTKQIIAATQNWFGHVMSDIAGSSTSKERGAGLPVPGWAALQKLQVGSFKIKDKSMNMAQVSEWMYKNGYDVRSFTAQLIPVIVNETLVRTYWIMKQHLYYGETIKDSLSTFSKREVERLLLVSCAVFSTLDLGDATLKSKSVKAGTLTRPGGATGTFLMTMNIPELADLGLHAVQNVRNEIAHRKYIEGLIDEDIEKEWTRIMRH